MCDLRPLVLLVAATGVPACAVVGHASQRTVEATGIVLTSAVGTPAVGVASWPAWNYLGGQVSRWLSGTEEVRIAAGKATGPDGPQLQSDPNRMNIDSFTLLLLAGIAYAIAETRRLRKELDELYDQVNKRP